MKYTYLFNTLQNLAPYQESHNVWIQVPTVIHVLFTQCHIICKHKSLTETMFPYL